MYIFALNLTCMEQINTIDKISAVYRNTAEEARQELNKVQQKIYRIGSLRLLLFVAGVVGIIYFWSESWGILACIALITLLPFLFFNEIPQPAVPSQGLSGKEDGNQRAGTRRSELRYVFFR